MIKNVIAGKIQNIKEDLCLDYAGNIDIQQ